MLRILTRSGTGVLRDAGGATAIEYAIIGALIGIGLVGSLVTTKGSLNAIFGSASGQMGSASGASAAAAPAMTIDPNNPRASFWRAKTLTSGPTETVTSNAKLISAAFSDGSSVSYVVASNYSMLRYMDPASKTINVTYLDTAGAVTAHEIDTYTDATFATMSSIAIANGGFSGNVPTTETAGPCNDGRCTTGAITPTASFKTAVANAVNDAAIWAANVQ